jgi:hypothetical protein
MAAYTLAQAQAQLDAWMAASAAVAASQSYRINDRMLTRADADMVLEQVKFWRDEVNKLTAAANGSRRTRYGVIG